MSGGLQTLEYSLLDETTALTTGVKLTTYLPDGEDFFVTGAEMVVTTAPTGAALIVDVNDDGTSIFGINKLQVDATEFRSADSGTAVDIDLDSGDIAAGSKLTFEVDQIGSTVAGAGAKILLYGFYH